MIIERVHGRTREEAKKKINNFLEELMRQAFPGGVKIKDAEKRWNGNRMNFSFKVKKGIVGTKICGSINITDDSVTLNSDLPGMVTTFVSEEKIKEVINREFDDLFQMA